MRGGFNLSFESLTSPAALKVVRELPRVDPDLWAKISTDYTRGGGDESDDDLADMPDLGKESDFSDTKPVPVTDDESVIVYDNDVDIVDESVMKPADLMARIVTRDTNSK